MVKAEHGDSKTATGSQTLTASLDLTRQALARRLAVEQLPIRDGFRYLPKRGGTVTPELIARLANDKP